MKGLNLKIFLGVLALALLSQSFFVVKEYQLGLVLQLGEPLEGIRQPGLHAKLPFIQSAVLFDRRVQYFDIPKNSTFSSDQKLFEIDNYVCWRIVDPLLFYRRLVSENVAGLQLRNIVNEKLKAAIGNTTLKEIVDTKRKLIMETVLEKSSQEASEYGVAIVDVRIKRADLPNRQAIFDRMRADRKKMANQYRAEGESTSREIRSQADRTRDVILAEAQRNSTIIKGTADAKALEVLTKALSTSPDFYEFSKSMDVYRQILKTNTKIILSFDSPLFKYLQ